MLKQQKRKVKKKKDFDEGMRRRAEYQSWCISLEKDNHLLKQSFPQFRNESLVRRSSTNSRIYSTIMSICKNRKVQSFTTSIIAIWHMNFVMYQAQKYVLKQIFIQLVIFFTEYQIDANQKLSFIYLNRFYQNPQINGRGFHRCYAI